MAIEEVKKYFSRFNMEDKIKELENSSATVELAALALNVEPDRIAKTLSFMVGDKPILIVTSGNSKIDNSKYKAAFHKKAKMMTPEEVFNITGHKIGGVCPFALKERVEVYLDNSLKKYETVYPAAGSSNSAIELTIEELEKFANPILWVDVCK
ncbi:TPA: YbaK/EbsC family protein [Candidatus Galligastranaerophilus intestinigallinarum]|nr:YbaK/EbsC family protein [Candidatus Galligastranaerophilus intestinigallinarum]